MDRGLTADDVARALWRRPWVVLAVSGLVLVLGAAYVLTRPRVWKATSVVRVEPQQTDAQLVQRTVGDVEPRLLSLRQAMLGGPVLSKVVDQLKLYPDLVARRGKEAAIEQLREAIDVKPTWNAFEVTVSAGNPKTAADIANLVPTVFGQLTNETRAAQAADATRVFDAQVKGLQATVNDWQQKIIAFKVAHVGELPEQMEANMRQLDRLSGEVRARTEQLRAADARRSDLVLLRNGGDTEVGRAQTVADQLEQQLAAAKTQYTDDHPEVVRLSRELKAARARAHEADTRLGAQRDERSRAGRDVAAIQRDIDGAPEGDADLPGPPGPDPAVGGGARGPGTRVRHRAHQVPVGAGAEGGGRDRPGHRGPECAAPLQPDQPGGPPGGPVQARPLRRTHGGAGGGPRGGRPLGGDARAA